MCPCRAPKSFWPLTAPVWWGRTVKPTRACSTPPICRPSPTPRCIPPPTLRSSAPSSPTWWRRARGCAPSATPGGRSCISPPISKAPPPPPACTGRRTPRCASSPTAAFSPLPRNAGTSWSGRESSSSSSSSTASSPSTPPPWRRHAPAAMCSSLRRASSGAALGSIFPSCWRKPALRAGSTCGALQTPISNTRPCSALWRRWA